MRLIDADALIADLYDEQKHSHLMARFKQCTADIVDLKFLLNEAPTIDAAPQWVSVKERLPNKQDGDVVLIIGANGGFSIAYTSDRTIINPKNNTAYFMCPNQRSGRNATYWMPLPEPPKEEE